ncbi:hypothetical protein EV683_101156 [Crenobacter luteus]|uniref:Uncharacterized protein n=1 Tax=Crenobacter luteus TaxID=1452487 RepID=A0A165F747_9NEIS|nr:hypothetical protein [Crenobacter luteus]KZE31764.1 hypothetical protein AVW16_00840 [Crenobacter luteus]TCP15628.1 hypothetical protein EV683_101156 [Crenobacter luteus]
MDALIKPLDTTPAGTQRKAGVAAPARLAESGEPAARRAPEFRAIGGWRYSSQLGEQLTAAQRAHDYVDGLVKQLETLKGELSRGLTQRRVDADGLKAGVDAFAERLGQRHASTGGSLDGAWRFRLAGDARQAFTVRGMELASLTGGDVETLALFAGERGTAALTVQVGGGLGEAEVLRRFNRALAPAGVRVDADDAGRLRFSVDEAAWPALAERLAIRGGGIRFPSGQPQRLRAEPEAEALRPGEWRVADHSDVRQTLQRVVQALAQLQQTQQAISRAMEETRASIAKLSHGDERVWAEGFVADFNARLNQPGGYGALYEVMPALIGVSRYRVVSLLAL